MTTSAHGERGIFRRWNNFRHLPFVVASTLVLKSIKIFSNTPHLQARILSLVVQQGSTTVNAVITTALCSNQVDNC